ncbi:hypothetical protein C414_000440036 [Campylobacter jejuni subsp. jejuni 414]|nr:hypothetical protein C414_000440036 [Campylobacter jejuni subsp. jejuni 414]
MLFIYMIAFEKFFIIYKGLSCESSLSKSTSISCFTLS